MANRIPDFESLYDQNAQMVLNLCYRMVGDEQTARDLAQDIWLKIFQKLDTFEGKSAVSTWIYRIALNHLYNFFKQEKRRKWHQILEQDLRQVFTGSDNSLEQRNDSEETGPHSRLEKKEREKIVWRCIQQLPPKQRIPLILFRYEALSYQEIATVLNISLQAVESRLHRAKRKLQKLLEPFLDEM